MVRRTKEDAEMTRNRLLDAAQEVFHAKGVSGASLTEVAQAASLTRGAIYWHFKDKADLFDAMMKRTTLPFEQAWNGGPDGSELQGPALPRILNVYRMLLHAVSTQESTQRVFDIALYKVECVGEMMAVRERRLMGLTRFTKQVEAALLLAAKQQGRVLPIPSASAAIGMHATFDGVLHAWLLHDVRPFDLEQEGMTAVVCYLKGLGLNVSEEIAQNSEN